MVMVRLGGGGSDGEIGGGGSDGEIGGWWW